MEQRVELTRTEQNLMLLSAETQLGLEMTCMIFRSFCRNCLSLWFNYFTGMSFLKLVPYLFIMLDVESFLSQGLCQDPLERFLVYKGREGVKP